MATSRPAKEASYGDEKDMEGDTDDFLVLPLGAIVSKLNVKHSGHTDSRRRRSPRGHSRTVTELGHGHGLDGDVQVGMPVEFGEDAWGGEAEAEAAAAVLAVLSVAPISK